MRLFARKIPPFQAYVAAVIGLGFVCIAGVFAVDGANLSRVASAEVAPGQLEAWRRRLEGGLGQLAR